MQAKSLCYAHNFFCWKTSFILKTSFITDLKHCVEDLKNLETWLNW
jgi:hypothetical protein